MTIYYKSFNLTALIPTTLIMISDIDNRGADTLHIRISGIECSYVLINGRKYKLNNGTANINSDEIERGAAEVMFISGTRKIHASPFLKSEYGIERIAIDSAAVAILEQLLVSVGERLGNIEKKIKTLEEKTMPKNIFKFS